MVKSLSLKTNYFEKGKNNLKEVFPTPLMEINHISKMFACHMRRAADEKGIPSGYRALLFHLSHHPEGLTPIELAQKTHLSTPTVSVTLQKMERDGYTYRVVNDSDQRSFKVFLTEKGNVTEDHNREIAKAFDQKALANLSEEEISTLLSLLSKVKNNIIGGDSPKGN